MQTSTSTKGPQSRKWSVATMAGALASAVLASACCIGPLLLGLVGLGGAGLLIKLEPYRPYFTGATLAALGAGFYFTYGKPKVAEGDACGCEHPKSNRAGKFLLWLVTVLVIGFWTFPYVAEKILG